MNIKQIFFGLFCAASLAVCAQSKTLTGSYIFVNNNHPEKADFYMASINAADMEQYRLRDTRVHLLFENGFEIEMYSAKELFMKGAALNMNNYPSENAGKPPVFFILPSGHLTAKIASQEKKQQP